MRYDFLLEPVSEEMPCGPDLDETGDEAYLNYVLPAADRLPERFFDRETGVPFDRSSIDLKAELKTIAELMERTRDLRLLALEARFQALGGQLVACCECIQAMSLLVDERWEDVHPQAIDGDFTLRQNTLAALDDRATIILPLEYAPLATDKRVGPIGLRDYRVANGEVEARGGEGNAPDLATVLDAMRADAGREGIEAAHAAVVAAEDALRTMVAKFQDAVGYEAAPGFDALLPALAQMRTFIETALPALQTAETSKTTDDALAESSVEPPPSGAGAGTQAADSVPVAAASVTSHAEAAAALMAVERYFTANEPSSPAIILVHQARTLVGKPLVTALDTLLPQQADRALISLDNRAGLQLAMPAMRSITETVTNGAAARDEGETTREFRADTRKDAESVIHGVEAFFHKVEPSSPIPMLLAKARTYMNRDFAAILADIIKTEPQEVSS